MLLQMVVMMMVGVDDDRMKHSATLYATSENEKWEAVRTNRNRPDDRPVMMMMMA